VAVVAVVNNNMLSSVVIRRAARPGVTNFLCSNNNISLLSSINNNHNCGDSSSSSFLKNSKKSFVTLPRRRRRYLEERKKKEEEEMRSNGGIELKGFKPSEEKFEDYQKKASLSPWVPVPDVIARRMLELAKAGPSDVHVELGSGDGRVNFQAIDEPYTVKRSIGVEIDESLINTSNERKAKRHPQPPNLEFRQGDLMAEDDNDENSIWKTIANDKDVTIITMYFVKSALTLIRPKLEEALGEDRKCRVICCGYSMPGWDSHWVESILGLNIFVYNYNTPHSDSLPKFTDEEIAELGLEKEEINRFVSRDDDEKGTQWRSADSQWDDVEEIVIPDHDPNDDIDLDLVDFDAEDEVDLDGNPAITKWRPPE